MMQVRTRCQWLPVVARSAAHTLVPQMYRSGHIVVRKPFPDSPASPFCLTSALQM